MTLCSADFASLGFYPIPIFCCLQVPINKINKENLEQLMLEHTSTKKKEVVNLVRAAYLAGLIEKGLRL